MSEEKYVPEECHIEQFFNCNLCLKELPEGESPQSYKRYDVGWTVKGIQVWCLRHDCNVLHMDFEGAKHPATTDRLP